MMRCKSTQCKATTMTSFNRARNGEAASNSAPSRSEQSPTSGRSRRRSMLAPCSGHKAWLSVR